MPNPVQSLFLMLATATDRELARQVQYLKVENRILRARLPKWLNTTPAERQQLLKYGRPLGKAINQLITIVVPATFRWWVRQADGRKAIPGKSGRPKKPPVVRELILKIARETGWGYTRVLGEFRKLTTRKVSRQTVANIMREAGLDPGPKRGEGTWDEFVKMHAKTLWQCDFLTKRIWTLKGIRDYFALAFIHVDTRRVFVTKSTAHPNTEWMAQQAEAFAKHAGPQADLVFHDSDAKFRPIFAETLKLHRLRVRRLLPVSPNLNAFIERWIQSIQQECLDRFMVFGERHFDHLISEYVDYYHTERPHQGLRNVPLTAARPPDENMPAPNQIECHERLGGLLKHFSRKAA